jgi:hypothetical protein
LSQHQQLKQHLQVIRSDFAAKTSNSKSPRMKYDTFIAAISDDDGADSGAAPTRGNRSSSGSGSGSPVEAPLTKQLSIDTSDAVSLSASSASSAQSSSASNANLSIDTSSNALDLDDTDERGIVAPVDAWDEGDGNDQLDCPRCILLRKNPPSKIDSSRESCDDCWNTGSAAFHAITYHGTEQHHLCTTKDYPEEELKLLASSGLSQDELLRYMALWRHAHANSDEGPGGDHSLCKPHYLFGCTEDEQIAEDMVRLHRIDDHSQCSVDYPDLALHEEELSQALPEEDKMFHRAFWRHVHGRHDLCSIIADDPLCDCTEEMRQLDLEAYPGEQSFAPSEY